jgi:NAD-dependent dihydropyrimidine dehydrogenase PreA subunit
MASESVYATHVSAGSAKASACARTSMVSTSVNTLEYNPELCINCGMCSIVCPHAVFAPDGHVAQLVRPEACMECGACQRNCPTGAITVDSGVGCAAAMIYAALRGKKEPICGPEPESESGPEPESDDCCTSGCCCS